MQSSKADIVQKPWGYEEWWAHNSNYIGKLVHIQKGHRLAMQYHKTKHQTIRVMSGVLTLTLGDQVRDMIAGDVAHIEPCIIHRLEARHDDVTFMEVSTPEVHDTIRVQDATA